MADENISPTPPPSLPENSPDSIERLGTGITREVMFNGQVVIFNLSDLADATVDIWIEACLRRMHDCVDKNEPLLVLQNFSNRNIFQTEYSQKRGAELTALYPELKGRIAFLLPDTIQSRRIQVFIESQTNQSRERRVFFSRISAIRWLSEGIIATQLREEV